MKICIASWAPFHAGAEVAAERLAVGLQEAGHEVLMLVGTNGETSRRMRAIGLRCEYVPMAMTDKWHWWRYAESRRQLTAILCRERPDIVHSNDLPTSQMVGQAAGRLGIPRVCHHRFPFGATAIDWLNKFGAERHVFVSAALKNEMCADSARLAGAPCGVMHDGLPLDAAPDAAARRAARKQLDLSTDKTLVLFAGQIIERKGVADLLYAWQQLPQPVHDRADLLIVGDDLQNGGAYRSEMQGLAAQLNVRAKFVGFQSNVDQWLTAVDVAIVPSHVEPLGNATLEAMAHALPVIGSDIGGIPEVIVHGETGLLVSPRDPKGLAAALERLINSPEERNRLGEAGRRRCEKHFSIEAHVEKMIEQYRLAMAALESPALA